MLRPHLSPINLIQKEDYSAWMVGIDEDDISDEPHAPPSMSVRRGSALKKASRFAEPISSPEQKKAASVIAENIELSGQ